MAATKRKMASKDFNIANQKFGRLTVLTPLRNTLNGHTLWVCRCDCGKQHEVTARSLVGGDTQSCGCYAIEVRRKNATKHGMCGSPEYQAWLGMRDRCSNPNDVSFLNYGGRGITVCDRWMKSFENFFSDMGQKPSEKHSIERRDNDKGYFPENCYWADRKKQNSNQRSNRRITYEGQTKIASEWAVVLGVPYGTLLHRLNKSGLTGEEVVRSFICEDANKTYLESAKEKARENGGKSRSQYWIVTTPDNKTFKIFSLNRFCKINGLAKSAMLRVANSSQSNHKGWLCRRPTEEEISQQSGENLL